MLNTCRHVAATARSRGILAIHMHRESESTTCTPTHTHIVWSVGHHGPTDVLVEKLNPMLVKYKVAAYFSGHDHDMQHLNDSGVQYFLSGAGHLVESSQKHKVGKKF